MVLGWRLTQTPCKLDGRGLAASYDSLLKHICIRAIRGEFYFGAGSRLLFLAEFLESGIGAQRIPDWIEFKKGLMQLAYERRCSLGITRFCR